MTLRHGFSAPFAELLILTIWLMTYEQTLKIIFESTMSLPPRIVQIRVRG